MDAAGSADDYFDAGGDCAALLLRGFASDDDNRAEAGVPSNAILEFLVNLLREFTGRSHYHSIWAILSSDSCDCRQFQEK